MSHYTFSRFTRRKKALAKVRARYRRIFAQQSGAVSETARVATIIRRSLSEPSRMSTDARRSQQFESRVESLRQYALNEGLDLNPDQFAHLDGPEVQPFLGDVSDQLIDDLVQDDISRMP
jgi:hypothetical protein